MKDYRTPVLLFLLAAILITLLSCCSWLYPLQPHDDANWFMAIGKSMLSGKLLYTEVHDQKGPLLFFLHEWAAALSGKTFFGIYLVEVVCCFFFLRLSYKTMRMFAGHGISLAATCLTGVVTYASDFMMYGDTVEELSLPVLLLVLYHTLRYAKQNVLPSTRESVVVGIVLAAVFWMKFTLLALCGGAFAALFILAWQRKEVQSLMLCVAWAVAGAGILTACVLLYFVVHGNEADLYRSYFYFNIFNYANAGLTSQPQAWWFLPLKLVAWGVLVGIMLLPRTSRDVKLAVVFCWGAVLLTFVFFKVYLYYLLVIFAFAPLGIYYFRRLRLPVFIAGSVLVAFWTIGTNYNLMTLLTDNFPKAILPLAETINADSDQEKQVLTLNSYDTGVYTQTDCLPPIKFFCTPNAYVEELVREQTDFLESCKAKYIIMKTEFNTHYSTFRPNIDRDYVLVQEESYVHRKEFILHPLEYLWSLGYMRGFIERFYTPEKERIIFRLYRRKDDTKAVDEWKGLVGTWRMNVEKDINCELSVSDYRIARYKEYEGEELIKDLSYSIYCKEGRLILGYISTGEECESAVITEHTDDCLVLRGWPKRGENLFVKHKE